MVSQQEVGASSVTGASRKRTRQSSQNRWTDDENLHLIQLVSAGGKNWGKIAQLLGSGRSAGSVEQHWYIIKKQKLLPGGSVGDGLDEAVDTVPSDTLFAAAQAMLGIETQGSKPPDATVTKRAGAKDARTLAQVDALKQRYKKLMGSLPRGRLSNDITGLTNKLVDIEADSATNNKRKELNGGDSHECAEGGSVTTAEEVGGKDAEAIVGRRPGQSDIFAAKKMQQLWQQRVVQTESGTAEAAANSPGSERSPTAAALEKSATTSPPSETATGSPNAESESGAEDLIAAVEADVQGGEAAEAKIVKRRNKLGNACKSCGSTTHFRKSHWSCPFNAKKLRGEAVVGEDSGSREVSQVAHGATDARSSGAAAANGVHAVATQQQKDSWTVQWSEKYQESFWWHPVVRHATWLHPVTGSFPDGCLPAEQPAFKSQPQPVGEGSGERALEKRTRQKEKGDAAAAITAAVVASGGTGGGDEQADHPLKGLFWNGQTGEWQEEQPPNTSTTSITSY